MKLSIAAITLFAASTEAGVMDMFKGDEAQPSENGERAAWSNRRLATAPKPNASKLAVAEPRQEFYVPLPEDAVFNDMFRKINNGKDSRGRYYVRGNMIGLLSVAVSTDHTVMWVDHWEDGYEKNVMSAQRAKTTEVWGDGDASNGCRPGIVNCKDSDDFLNAGDSFVIQETMSLPRKPGQWKDIKIDGGDRIQASYPVTMTRGEYSQYPGSLLAGAVEIHDTRDWGTDYIVPVGTNSNVLNTQAFQYSRVFIMSGSDNNKITLPNGTFKTLNQGESTSVSVQESDKISSTAPIQLDLCTGDIGSNYELRWFSLLPTSSWSDTYHSPVGDNYGRTKMVLFNPNTKAITVTMKYLKNGRESPHTITIQPKKAGKTIVVPTGSGASLTSPGNNFIALSLTDSEMMAGDSKGQYNFGGRAFDWGFPVVPTNKLTPQVLVGWGYGCTSNSCQGKTERSAVWISPVANADVFIDYQNTGKNYEKISMKKLESKMIRDTKDHDMSGAIIFATKAGTGANGPPVDIAAAWGQDPSVSLQDQHLSLDLGTVVLPFTTLRATKKVSKEEASPGDELTYTINVQNVGQTEVKSGQYQIKDPLVKMGTYVKKSTKYSADGGQTWFDVRDDTKGTPYPLDEAGLASQRNLVRRGGEHHIKFKVIVDEAKVNSDRVINVGSIVPPVGREQTYKAVTKLNFDAEIDVDNIVYVGDKGTAGCGEATDSVSGTKGTVVTYCFKVKNTGKTHLANVRLTNNKVSLKGGRIDVGKLAPNESKLVTYVGAIDAEFRNTVTAKGNPVFANGANIPGIPDPAASDPSGVKMEKSLPAIGVENTVYKGQKGANECKASGVEEVKGPVNTEVTYCFKVTNKGNTHLNNIRLNDPKLNYKRDDLIDLAPGASTLVAYPMKISETLENTVIATGSPCNKDGKSLGMGDVKADDPSGVKKIVGGDTQGGGKELPEKCMQDAWKDAGNSDTLSCRSKEVFVEKITSPRLTCKEGEMIKLSMKASVRVNSGRYDVGWYTALDGGDALVGTCDINGFKQGKEYQVNSDMAKSDTVGEISWNNDAKGGNDSCGDIAIKGGGGGSVKVEFLEEQEIKCVDNNNDGNLDFSYCSSWRTANKDAKCTLTRYDDDTMGKEADLFPGLRSACFCEKIDVPTVTVIKPNSDDHVSPC